MKSEEVINYTPLVIAATAAMARPKERTTLSTDEGKPLLPWRSSNIRHKNRFTPVLVLVKQGVEKRGVQIGDGPRRVAYQIPSPFLRQFRRSFHDVISASEYSMRARCDSPPAPVSFRPSARARWVAAEPVTRL